MSSEPYEWPWLRRKQPHVVAHSEGAYPLNWTKAAFGLLIMFVFIFFFMV